jgi:hypothetical protein
MLRDATRIARLRATVRRRGSSKNWQAGPHAGAAFVTTWPSTPTAGKSGTRRFTPGESCARSSRCTPWSGGSSWPAT